MTKTPAAKDPTRNVWLQLGFPDAEEHFLKAELVLRLRTGQADLPHPALGQDLTPSPTTRRAQACSDARARSARKDAGVDRSRPCVA
jgi:hypothetical protein